MKGNPVPVYVIIWLILVGLELTFFSGVYGTCITHTGEFGDDANSLIGFSGMLIGGGEILGIHIRSDYRL